MTAWGQDESFTFKIKFELVKSFQVLQTKKSFTHFLTNVTGSVNLPTVMVRVSLVFGIVTYWFIIRIKHMSDYEYFIRFHYNVLYLHSHAIS